MSSTRRRFLLIASAGIGIVAAGRGGRAQGYPSRHVTLVVPVGAGGAPDLFARLLGEQMAQRLGQPFVIENRPGVGGSIAMQAVARAPADGHTLLLMFTPHAVGTTLYPDVNANLTRDIAPVIGLTGDNFVVVVSPSLPVRSLSELIAYAKANPGKLNMASSGAGNMSHLAGEMFKMMAGVNIVHVPYRSAPAALSDVMTGNVQMMFDAIPSSRPHVEAGKLRGLAVTGKAAHALLPGLPTVDSLLPGYEVTGWMGVGVPRGTPQQIVDALEKGIIAMLADPAIKARLADVGSTKLELTAVEFGKLIADDTRKWAEVIRFAGLAKGR